jgi:hypothetical protein
MFTLFELVLLLAAARWKCERLPSPAGGGLVFVLGDVGTAGDLIVVLAGGLPLGEAGGVIFVFVAALLTVLLRAALGRLVTPGSRVYIRIKLRRD